MAKLIKPTPSNYKSRGFSNAEGHRGIDYGWENARVAESQKILAAGAGTVIYAYAGNGYNGGWGRRIKIDHGHGIVTAYSHIRPGGVLVTEGQKVSAGQLIAHMGSSGASRGTHLHYELYENGVRVDPEPYFTRDLPGTAVAPAPASSGSSGQKFHVPAGGQYYYWDYNNALEGDFARNQLLRGNQVLDVVSNPGTGPVRVRCADGDLVWVGTRNNPAAVSAGSAPAQAPAPTTRYFDVPAAGQFYYWQYQNALEGDYDASQLLRGGQTLAVVENPGTGPVRVRAADGDLVWVGTRRNPAKIR